MMLMLHESPGGLNWDMPEKGGINRGRNRKAVTANIECRYLAQQ